MFRVTTVVTGHATLSTFSSNAGLLSVNLLNRLRFHLQTGLPAASGVQLLWACFQVLICSLSPLSYSQGSLESKRVVLLE